MPETSHFSHDMRLPKPPHSPHSSFMLVSSSTKKSEKAVEPRTTRGAVSKTSKSKTSGPKASKSKTITAISSALIKQELRSDDSADDLPQAPARQNVSSDALIPASAAPEPKFRVGNVAGIRTKQIFTSNDNLLVAIHSSEYDRTVDQHRYVCVTDVFGDIETTINVWEDNLVRPKEQVGEAIQRTFAGSVKIEGFVKSVIPRGGIFEYRFEFQPLDVDDDEL